LDPIAQIGFAWWAGWRRFKVLPFSGQWADQPYIVIQAITAGEDAVGSG